MSTRKETYRYAVILSVKTVDALEDLILRINDDEGYLLVDVEEREEYKKLPKEERT